MTVESLVSITPVLWRIPIESVMMSSMKIRITPYRASDRTEIVRLMVTLQDIVAKLDPLKRLRTAKDFDGEAYFDATRAELGKNHTIFVARENNRVVGMVIVSIVGTKRSPTAQLARKPHLGKTGFIAELVVDASLRNSGVGTALLTHAEQFFRSKKCTTVSMSVFINNTAALKFYKKHKYILRTVDVFKKL